MKNPFNLAAVAISLVGAACNGATGSPSCALRVPRHLQPATQCGDAIELTPINAYRGDLDMIQDREGAVVLIDGTCTGTLVAAHQGPIVLTAGHCVSPGQQVVLSFNFETDPDGDPLVTSGTTIEQSAAPDYALIRPAALPMMTSPTPLTMSPASRLAIIQHPRGRPKQIAEGLPLDDCDDVLLYRVDTLPGSSGAGVLSESGFVVAVHSDGDCSKGGGANWGATTSAIVEASTYLTDADLSLADQ